MPEYQFDRLRMHVDAVNGQLPDIDLVRYENIYIYKSSEFEKDKE